MKTKRDIEQNITDTIIAALETGVKPWARDWGLSIGGMPLRHCGKPYRGINVLILAMTPFSNPYWMTFKQAKEYGACVRKGEKSTAITFFKSLNIQDKATGEDKTIPLLRSYAVFNADQIDGLPERFYPKPIILNTEQRQANAESFIAATQAEIRHGGNNAYFSPSLDFIQVPDFASFETGEGYYSTLLHELTHWTGHASRLNRNLKDGFGTKDYCREELTAEIGAAYLCAHTGVSNEPRADHAEYLAGWLTILKEDKKAIFRAAALAQKAVDHLFDYQEQKESIAA